MCLLSFNLRSLASTCSSSVGNNFSFESAHLKALFCNTCLSTLSRTYPHCHGHIQTVTDIPPM